jgi:hypothetical protein
MMRLCLQSIVAATFSVALIACGGGTGGGGEEVGEETAIETGEETGIETEESGTEGSSESGVETSTGEETETGQESGEETGGDDFAPTCALDVRLGGFIIGNYETDGYSTVSGSVAEGVIPLTVLQPKEFEEGCQLLQKDNPFCDPPCGAGQLCDHDGGCVPYPENREVGTVTVTGLNVGGPIVMEPKNNMYFDTTVSYPVYDSGADIQVQVTGGEVLGVGGFTLQAKGIPSLVVPDRYWSMEDGKTLDLSWTPEEGHEGEIYFSLNVDQHGNSPVSLFCRVKDTGSHAVSANLVSTMLSYGVSGFATADLYRRDVDTVNLPAGCVDLQVLSHVQGMLSVEGHTACFNDLDCPEGEICQFAIQTCVEE